MPIRPVIAVAAAAAVIGCSDFKAMFALSAALQKEYHVPANVNLNNRTHLSITLQNLPAGLLDGDDSSRQRFARELATFAKSHYAESSRLDDITIAFANVRGYGPVTVTRTDAPFSFRIRELPDVIPAAPPNER
jgi:hypothetical protein